MQFLVNIHYGKLTSPRTPLEEDVPKLFTYLLFKIYNMILLHENLSKILVQSRSGSVISM